MANSILINSLKRLYKSGQLTLEQMKERVQKGTISEEDFEAITGEVYD